MFIYLLCLSAALLCYTGFQNQSLISLIRSIFSPCSTCCFGLGFSTTKPTCRNTSKDLGHNSRTSFSAPSKKWAFFAQKWPKNVNIDPKTLFPGLGRSVQCPPTLFCGWLTQKNINCMVSKPQNMCFRAAPPKKWPLFGQKWPTIANFWQKGSFFGLGCSVQGPPTLFLRCWTPKKHILHGIEARKWVFQGRPTQKMGIFCSKMA